MSETPEGPVSSGRREKQKIRIKYRQRVKLKKRPRGYKISRFWKKRRKTILAMIVFLTLLGATTVVVFQLIEQQIELKQHQGRQKLRMK